MIGLLAAVIGVLITLGTILSLGMAVFQKMRTRDRIKIIFAAPFAGMMGALIAAVGYSFAGYGDIPPGYGEWLFPVIFGVFGVGVILGIIVRAKGVTSPAIVATEMSAMKVCPRCSEKVQGAARVCRFCGHAFDG